jgi:cysteinyl-tRNA synthetase
MDLKFPHHECEIAQCQGANGKEPAKYWIHSNMLTANGQKMSKSLGNVFLTRQLFSGDHPLLSRAYSPMTVRFFLLQTHYASTLDISSEALDAAAKGYYKLMNASKILQEIEYAKDLEINEKIKNQVDSICDNVFSALNDDFNTALAIGHLFNLVKKVNSMHIGQFEPGNIGKESFTKMKETLIRISREVLGLKEEKLGNPEHFLATLIKLYKEAKESKNYDKVDEIRNSLKGSGVVLKDTKKGVEWAYEES